jgi:putative colanic acid biosynthesis glycosyltransferase
MERTFFSIVTVVLNDVAGIRKTMASIVGQTFQDFEWIVVDGLSTDGTLEAIRDCGSARLRAISEKDSGLYNAMSKGQARARGSYLLFLNGGDCLYDTSVLHRVHDAIGAHGGEPALVYGDAYEDDGQGGLYFKRARGIEWLRYGMITHHQAIFYAVDAARDLRFVESYRIAGDYEFTSRIYMQGGATLKMDLPVCTFARGGVSETKAQVGRAENWKVQRDVLRESLMRRVAVRAGYLLSAFVRTYCRGLYDRVRFREATHAD